MLGFRPALLGSCSVVYIYIYIYICMYVCMYVYIYIYIYKHIDLYVYIHIFAWILLAFAVHLPGPAFVRFIGYAVLDWKLISGSFGTAAVTPFVLTPSRSCQLPASIRGRDKQGFHRRATNSRHFAACCFKRACCHSLPTFSCESSLGGTAAPLRRPRLSRPRPEAGET